MSVADAMVTFWSDPIATALVRVTAADLALADTDCVVLVAVVGVVARCELVQPAASRHTRTVKIAIKRRPLLLYVGRTPCSLP
ncbi:hypothetical protein [Flexivirga oryzae]|uniref:Uncharacterized protein n=1 Tax=Flexivirga oryzae TaxID=1794944 RepID=A0A839N932_9MICO|nr:hypothetical protein [Flexivirga oryzae]MBB2893727.1 hypothetical protein [Flexivirga oryzae]